MTKFRDEADDYDFLLRRETDNAWCVRDYEGVDVWLPKHYVECDKPRVGAVCVFTIPNWMAEEKGLLE